MAKYDNKFLVQYFKDIYALHILRDKVEEHIEDIELEISQLEEGKYYNPYPEQPKGNELGCGSLGCATPCVIIALVCFYGLINSRSKFESFMTTFFVIFFSIFAIIFIFQMVNDITDNRKAQIAYQQAIDEYNALEEENELCKNEISLLQNRVAQYKGEIRKIDRLIQKAYRINIIPNQYRNIYTIVYLYDYFEGSRETDLAMALNTFVLEQIKDRLDRIIAQMSEIILNQYTMIHNQERAAEATSRYHIDMKNRLKRIESSYEKQKVYLEMIESNTATMRYFATVDYLTK